MEHDVAHNNKRRYETGTVLVICALQNEKYRLFCTFPWLLSSSDFRVWNVNVPVLFFFCWIILNFATPSFLGKQYCTLLTNSLILNTLHNRFRYNYQRKKNRVSFITIISSVIVKNNKSNPVCITTSLRQ